MFYLGGRGRITTFYCKGNSEYKIIQKEHPKTDNPWGRNN
jgi:hypothetical protein